MAGLIAMPEPIHDQPSRGGHIAGSALPSPLPFIIFVAFTEVGGLLSYGNDIPR